MKITATGGTYTVAEVIEALQKVKDKNKPVFVLDKPAEFQANIALLDEDDEQVNIIIENWPSL
jgi:hypothetical protein